MRCIKIRFRKAQPLVHALDSLTARFQLDGRLRRADAHLGLIYLVPLCAEVGFQPLRPQVDFCLRRIQFDFDIRNFLLVVLYRHRVTFQHRVELLLRNRQRLHGGIMLTGCNEAVLSAVRPRVAQLQLRVPLTKHVPCVPADLFFQSEAGQAVFDRDLRVEERILQSEEVRELLRLAQIDVFDRPRLLWRAYTGIQFLLRCIPKQVIDLLQRQRFLRAIVPRALLPDPCARHRPCIHTRHCVFVNFRRVDALLRQINHVAVCVLPRRNQARICFRRVPVY